MSRIDAIIITITTANCVAVAATGGVTPLVGGGGVLSPTSADNYDDYAVLSRLHQAAAITNPAGFRSASHCTAMSQMRPGAAGAPPGTHQQTGGVVRGGAGSLHGGQASVGPGPAAGQTALPYAVGFALSPADMMRQPPIAGFQGTIRYDTVRYVRLTCDQKLTRWPAELNQAHGPETTKEGKNKIKNE